MTERRIPATTLVAVLVALVAGLIAREVFRAQLVKAGYRGDFSADLSYLVVPVVMMILLFPLWKSEKRFVIDQFRRCDINWKIAAQAASLGILLRLAWWCQLIAGASFGLYQSTDPNAIIGPVFSFQCSAPHVVALGFIVMVFLVPLIEELVNRVYVLSAARHRGALVSVLVSAIAFTVFHKYASWPFAFSAGIVFGLQYWFSKSIWPSLIAHATINAAIQLDWRCLSGHWNPPANTLPLLVPGIISSVLLVMCVLGIGYLLRRMAIEARIAPR